MKGLSWLASCLILIILVAQAARAQNLARHQTQIERVNYLLAIDRLDFYSDGLADYLMDHGRGELAQFIRSVRPEDYEKAQFASADLQDPDKWNELILATMQKKFPQLNSLTIEDFRWNHNFFRKKLLEGFTVTLEENKKKSRASSEPANSGTQLNPTEPLFVERTIPKVSGGEVLLDAERYISEKTTRAIFWDAALSGAEIEFHLGSEGDFRSNIALENRQVIGEVKTRARNYNKIYLVFDPKLERYSYAFTRISGDDRIKHLIAQLRLLKFEKKSAAVKESVRVYGNANAVHRQQETRLLNIFNSMPKADLVVMGQKAAISNLITMAGMMVQIQPDHSQSLETDNVQLKKLSKAVGQSGSYFSIAGKTSVVKTIFENMEGALNLNYEAFTTEQPSHDITDFLLETSEGKIVRWRLISNMWGDEVVPVARALKNSGHEKVVYIGTAGAMSGNGLAVGDVVAPAKTYNQKGKLFELESPQLGKGFVKTGATLGQVTSPFQETKQWFQSWQEKIQVVELETGYLRENLGDKVSFQPYLLISDIVGSEHETLAVAGADSGKRKSGQMKLLESLFITHGIKAPIGNLQLIGGNVEFRHILSRIEGLRSSRDLASKIQLAQLALRQGVKGEDELLKLIKSEPAFDRQLLLGKLNRISRVLTQVQAQSPKVRMGLVGASELLNGTWNPQRPLQISLMFNNLQEGEAARLFKQVIEEANEKFQGEMVLKIVNFDPEISRQTIYLDHKKGDSLVKYYEENIYKKLGFILESSSSGGYRLREAFGISGGLRCEAVLL